MFNIRLASLIFILTISVGAGCSWYGIDFPGSLKIGRLGGAGSEKLPDFVKLARDIRPIVVRISTTQAVRPMDSKQRLEQDHDESEGRENLFGVPPLSLPSRQHHGSGFIIDPDGTILTNAHVVEDAEKVVVKLADKREFNATVVGKDRGSDFALIKIVIKEKLPAAQFGDSDDLQVGEWVMAVGNPFGLENSVSSGIVSGKERHIGAGPYESFIQTDAPINPGSSGGPLVNARGQIVGINTAILSASGGNIGIGFATPINLVKDLLPQLKAEGEVTWGWAGLTVREVTADIARVFEMERPRGALVLDLAHGGPADRGGIRVGDIITEFDGREVNEAGDLAIMVARTQVKKKVQVGVVREKRKLHLALTIGKLEPGKRMEWQSEMG